MSIPRETILAELTSHGQYGDGLNKDPNVTPQNIERHFHDWVSSVDNLMNRVDPYWFEGGRSVGATWFQMKNIWKVDQQRARSSDEHRELRVTLSKLSGHILSASNIGPVIQPPPDSGQIGNPACHFHRRPITPDPRLVFVLQPFTPAAQSRRIFNAFDEAARAHEVDGERLVCKRADDFHGPDVMQDVYEAIASAACVIADTTGLNPNVTLELGMALTLGKEVFIVTRDGLGGIPFDVNRFRHQDFTVEGDGLVKLKAWIGSGFREILGASLVDPDLLGKTPTFKKVVHVLVDN